MSTFTQENEKSVPAFTEKQAEILKYAFSSVLHQMASVHFNTTQDLCQQAALLDVLVAKGVVTEEEVNEKINPSCADEVSENTFKVPSSDENTCAREWRVTAGTILRTEYEIDNSLSFEEEEEEEE